MRWIRFFLFLWFISLLPMAAAQVAQESAVQRYLEQWAEQTDQESIPEDLIELIQAYFDDPLNLNDTSSSQLLQLPFISQFQYESLKAYILQNGSLHSVSELALVYGFDSTTIRMLRPLCVATPSLRHRNPSLKQMLTGGKSTLLAGTRRTVELSRGYIDTLYQGSPYRLHLRYSYKYKDNLLFQLSGEKDPGEPFLSSYNPYGFDHYSGYLLVKNMGRLEQFVVGHYYLQFGQGLSLWTGYAPWNTTSTSSHLRYAQGIRQASATSEWGYLQGAASTLRIRPSLTLTSFYSYNNLDATLSVNDSLGQSVQSIYTSGYHRTENEQSKRNQLTEQLFGASLAWQRGTLMIRTTGYHSLYNKAIEPKDYPYNHYAFRGNRNSILGIDATYRKGNAILFGEASASYNDHTLVLCKDNSQPPLAALAGILYYLSSETSLGLSAHHYAATYQNQHCSTIGQSSSGQNEEGMQLSFHTLLPAHIELAAVTQLFRFPNMRYGTYAPSWGEDHRLQLSRAFGSHALLTLQYRYHDQGKNASQSGIDSSMLHHNAYPIEQTRRHGMQARLDLTPLDNWTFTTRLALSATTCEYHAPNQGFLLLQSIGYKPVQQLRPLSVTASYGIFDVSDYDARLYAVESDLVAEYSSTLIQGKGYRGYLVARWQLSPTLSLAAKYAITSYIDRSQIGSGYDVIDSPHRQEIKLQLKVNFLPPHSR